MIRFRVEFGGLMIDMTERSLPEPAPEDRRWAKRRIQILREVSRRMAELGYSSMVAGTIYVGLDDDLIEYAPEEVNNLPSDYRSSAPDNRGRRNPNCYRLKGRAKALVDELGGCNIRLERRMADPVEVLDFEGRPDAFVLSESMSTLPLAKRKGCANLEQLLLIVHW